MSLQVGFLRGKQSSINTLLAQSGDRFQAGAFYITEDSNRIYFAQSASNLQYLNKYITTVATPSDLPNNLTEDNIGDFYYITTGNILCRYDGDTTASGIKDKPQWTQVNAQIPDTDTTDRVTSLAIGDGALNNAKDAIEFTLTATEQSYDVKGGKYTGTARDIVTDTDKKFVLNKSILDTWYNKAAIELKDSVANNKATLSLSGTGTGTAKSVVITGGTHINIKDSADGFEISATDTDTNTTYTMASPAGEAKIHLDGKEKNNDPGNQNDAGTVEFKAGTDLVVDGSVAGEVKYSHKTDGYLTVAENQITAAQTPHQDETFDIITGVQTSNGHVTAVNTSTVKLPHIFDVKNHVSETASDNPTGKISIVVKDGAGDEKTITSSEQFGLKVGTTLVPLGGDLKNYFYTETEIDTKFADHLKSVNAMVFKGAVPAAGLPSGNDAVSIGDTYIMASGSGDVTAEGAVATTGDILIAYSSTGEEDDDGYIASANIQWTLVPGSEKDTTYTFSADDNNLILTSNATGDEGQKITVDGDAAVSFTADDNKLQVTHATTSENGLSTPTNAAKVQLDYNDATGFTVVTGVTANKYGHVTGITASKIALPGTHVLAHKADTGATELKDGKAGNVVGSIDVDGSGIITVATADNGKGTNYTVSHNQLTTAQQNVPQAPTDENATTLAHNGYFTAVTGATRDAYGHVTGYTVSKYKLPADNNTTYTLSGAAAETITANEQIQLTTTLTDSAGDSTTAKFRVKSLNENVIVATENVAVLEGETTRSIPVVKIDLTWGTF